MAKKYYRQKSGFAHFIDNLTEKEISLAASVGVGLFLFTPLMMAIPAMFIREIDFIVTAYPKVLREWVFTIATAVFLVAWILNFLKMKAKGASFFKAVKGNPACVIFLLALIWMFISQCVNGMGYALRGYYRAILEETFAMELGYIAVLVPGAALVKNEDHKLFLVRSHLIISTVLVLAAFVLWHTQSSSNIFYDWTERFASVFTNTNYYGYYLAVSVPLAAAAFMWEKHPAWRLAALGAFAVNTVGLSVNDTTGAWVGCVAALLFIFIAGLIVKKKFDLKILVIFAVFAVCLFVPGHILGTFESTASVLGSDIVSVISGDGNGGRAGSGRWGIWKDSVAILMYDPWFGVGFEGIAHWGYQSVSNVRPHNEFLQYALFHGIPAAVLYFTGAFMVFIRALRLKKDLDFPTLMCLSAAFGYLVSSFFGLTVYATAPYLFLFLGMGYAHRKAGT